MPTEESTNSWDYLKGLLEHEAEKPALLPWLTCKVPGCLALVTGAPLHASASVRVPSEPLPQTHLEASTELLTSRGRLACARSTCAAVTCRTTCLGLCGFAASATACTLWQSLRCCSMRSGLAAPSHARLVRAVVRLRRANAGSASVRSRCITKGADNGSSLAEFCSFTLAPPSVT